ncbi:MAG TPA: ATP-binding protein [Gaiellaceae bacterium]|nr:ATP-binding protein [Gaiellaceae bacterium]
MSAAVTAPPAIHPGVTPAADALPRGWQSRRPGGLPPPARAYLGAIVALALAASLVGGLPARDSMWSAFAILTGVAALAKLVSVSVGRNSGRNVAVAFVVAGALLLPPALVGLMAFGLHVPEWLRQRVTWYIQLFNIAVYALAGVAAWAAAEAIGGHGDLRFALAGAAAAVVFVLVNHVVLATMLRLARGHSLRESGLFAPSTLATVLALGGAGIALAYFWRENPWLVPTLVAPLALAHLSFSTVAKLRESEERFRAMFESAATATLLIGLDRRIVSANRSALELFGDDLVGTDYRKLLHPDQEPAAEFAALARGELDQYRVEQRLVTLAGDLVFGRVAVSLVRNADAQPEFVIAMIEDVTEQRELEERLRQAQKLEAIGRLAGGVAHDFNNMLTAIAGYTAFARDRAGGDAELASDLDEIRKATERATLLTRQLLAFSRKQVLQPELLNLNAIVVELESMLRPLIGEDVALTTRLDPALAPIEADPGQLQQVLMNLVVNARDAMPGGGSLVIETANADVAAGDPAIEPGRYVTMTVRDSGHGIDEATLEQIFEPFFTTKETGKGTGLGLATVYGIVKQSGGYVAVESEPGEGTSFTIYLPRDSDRAPVAGPEPEASPAEEPARAVATAGSETRTVLLVEDEEVVRRLVRQVLETAGYEVLEASDGEEALVVGRTRPADLLLTDLVMPRLGGREVADRLREHAPGLKVIYMSGYADATLLENGALQPGTELLEKPFTFATLTDTVRRVLEAS